MASLFHTLIESAKLAGVEPAAYLAEAALRAMANPGTITLPKDRRRHVAPSAVHRPPPASTASPSPRHIRWCQTGQGELLQIVYVDGGAHLGEARAPDQALLHAPRTLPFLR